MKRCPTPEQLEQFLDEDLDENETGSVARHVESCAECQGVLERLTEDDSVGSIQSVRAVSAVAVGSTEPQLAFLRNLKEAPRTGSLSRSSTGSTGIGSGGDSSSGLAHAIEGYEIQDVLGRGGMGIVYKARQVGLNRLIALKMILSGPHASPRDRSRFRQEAEAVARLHHPNIVQVYDVGESQGRPYLALEYINGGSLAKHLGGDPQAALPSAAIVEQLARAVDYAHRNGLAHRDLKPANVLLSVTSDPPPSSSGTLHWRTPDNREITAVPKITDFGLAKRLGEQEGGTFTGEVLGTPSYMAPEQASGKAKRVGAAVDVYALGAILYEMLTGRPPFKGATPFETVLQVLHEEPVRPGSLRPDLPRDLETVCLKCLAKDPARRYPSAAALAEDLHRFRQGKPVLARPVGAWERTWKWARRRPALAALASGIILVTALGFAGVTWQWQEARLARDSALLEKREKELQRQQAEDSRNEAELARRKEADQRERARQSLYFSRIARSQLQWRVNDLTGAEETLKACMPSPGLPDRRGWEWRYLHGLFHSELFSFAHSGSGAGGSVAFRPDGGQIVSVVGGHGGGDESPGELQAWDARGVSVQAIPVSGTWHRVTYRPDGKQLAIGCTDGHVFLLNAETGKELLRRKPHAEAVLSVAYNPDGNKLVTASWDRLATVLDANTGETLQVLRGHMGRVQAAVFHPDGTRIATAAWDGLVKLWNANDGKEIQELRGHKGPVYCIAFSPDGQLLASAGSNGNLKIWDLATGRAVQSLTGHAGSVLDVCFSPDGRYIAYGAGDGTVRVWEVEPGVEGVVFRGHTMPVESVHFSPDGQRLVSCSPAEGTVKVWDFTRHPRYATFAHTRADVEALAFHADTQDLLSLSVGGRLQRWDGVTAVLKDEHSLPAFETGARTTAPAVLGAFDPAGRRLAARTREDARVVKVWDTGSGAEVATLGGHTMPVGCVHFHKDGKLLATCAHAALTGDAPHEIKVWEIPGGKEVSDVQGHGAIFNAIFSPDGRYLALALKGGIVSVLDYSARQEVSHLSAHTGDVAGLAFSADGQWLASAGLDDRSIKLWDVPALAQGGPPRPLRRLSAPAQICDLAFAPDGKRLAAVTRDLVKLFDPATGQEVMTLRGAPQRHWDPPFNPRIIFSPDGKRLVASNWNESFSVWDADMPDDAAGIQRAQVERRAAADQRALFWHLQEAEHCLEYKNASAARYHLNRIAGKPLASKLEAMRDRIVERLPGK